ncbi:MAG: hypothetical protein LBH13_06085 [Cellulomonadaceae bacterium]|jgi:hypothetical protein|nr:hypothetical protein [Cellulomonadaceae bacterium]
MMRKPRSQEESSRAATAPGITSAGATASSSGNEPADAAVFSTNSTRPTLFSRVVRSLKSNSTIQRYRRWILAGAVALGLVAGGGLAYGYWTFVFSGQPGGSTLTAGYLDTALVSQAGMNVWLESDKGPVFIDKAFEFENVFPEESFAVQYAIVNTGTSPFYVQGSVQTSQGLNQDGSINTQSGNPYCTTTSCTDSYLKITPYVGASAAVVAGASAAPSTADVKAVNQYKQSSGMTNYTPASPPNPAWIGVRKGSCSSSSGITPQFTRGALTPSPLDLKLPAPTDATSSASGAQNTTGVIQPGGWYWMCFLIELPVAANPPATLQGASAPTLTFSFTAVQVPRS